MEKSWTNSSGVMFAFQFHRHTKIIVKSETDLPGRSNK
jgi:hypothetical protein